MVAIFVHLMDGSALCFVLILSGFPRENFTILLIILIGVGRDNLSIWHFDLRWFKFIALYESNKVDIFYLDTFYRVNARHGLWLTVCRTTSLGP